VLWAGNAVGVLHGGRHRHLHNLERVLYGRANTVAMLSRCGNRKLHHEFGMYELSNAVALLYRRRNGNLLKLSSGCDVYRGRSAGALLQRPRRGKLL